ncbi:uracil-DNA glycosylase [Maribacter sp. 1_MG-2023]|uniref:uracil-DNA glycosylase n=1 Tax=Maribacter sp. 1_MG-2023 TaxID=3062677 RepID=UPI0026E1D581|nr:uracil-DNA glycosylase [Maribacter sp. 1_MG-2023]MDO6470236.1 uracil-DNA glycosylase [Maribacter sp. 1_MG-2023]
MKFHPYIGETYSNSPIKLLVLGESHYCKKPACCFNEPSQLKCISKTAQVLQEYLNYKRGSGYYGRWMNTFTKFSNVLNGTKQSNKDSIKFWESVSFYNFVQVPMKKPRQSPSHQDFDLSYPDFKKAVKTVDPDLIFLWGDRLWCNIRKEDISGKRNPASNTFAYFKFEKDYPLLVLPHPSSSKFSYNLRGAIDSFIAKR